MRAFVVTGMAPRSVGAAHTATWKEWVVQSYRAAHDTAPVLDGDLYALVLYVHQRPTQLDADNLSKPVLDALSGVCYTDDRQVKVRTSGTLHLGEAFFDLADVDVPPALFDEFARAIAQEDHVVYAEIGPLHFSMYRMNREVPT
jgi:hypothetical protein